ncbi:hypothetical protein C8R44DRAFT_723546 [Mycena epipterygia]|nr:hypothetical protein C8R44DRAFT_723546 [Mycena epipterygia]
MGSTNDTNYDRSLLAQTPAATRAQLQEGYDSVLLAPNRRARRTDSDLALNTGAGSKEQEPQEQPAAQVYSGSGATTTTSFWRRRGGKILGVILALVAIAAVIGAAVGATSHKRSSSKDADTSDVGTGTLSSGLADSASIFGFTSAGSGGGESIAATPSSALSQDSVPVATQPVASSDIFNAAGAQVTARHMSHRRR